MVQIMSSDPTCEAWVPFGKFTVPLTRKDGKLDLFRFADGLAEGALTRLVRAQLIKGSCHNSERVSSSTRFASTTLRH